MGTKPDGELVMVAARERGVAQTSLKPPRDAWQPVEGRKDPDCSARRTGAIARDGGGLFWRSSLNRRPALRVGERTSPFTGSFGFDDQEFEALLKKSVISEAPQKGVDKYDWPS